MKKKFVVCKFNELKKNEALLKRSQIIGFPFVEPESQKSQFCLSNLEIPDNGTIEWDKNRQEITIRIRVGPEECLTLGDVVGDPTKVFIDGK